MVWGLRLPGIGYGVSGVGFGVACERFVISGSRYKVEDLGFKGCYGLKLSVWGVRVRMQHSGFRM